VAKCPKCDSSITSLNIEPLTFKVGVATTTYGGVSYSCCCPHCDAVLSAVLDPVAVKADIVQEFLNKRRKTK
jgi:hypothetical protein